jgi:UPF0755 protein
LVNDAQLYGCRERRNRGLNVESLLERTRPMSTARGQSERPRPSAIPGGAGVQARSPAEAIEPTRPPRRPKARSGRIREPRKLGPALRLANAGLTLTAIVLSLAAAATLWIQQEIERPGPLAETRGVIVKKGEGAREVAQRLEADGIIKSQHSLVAYYVGRQLATAVGARPLQIKAGEYEIPPGASLAQISDILGEGKSVLVRLTIPEGLTSQQIVERLRADPSLSGEITQMPPEGSLLPETYKVPRNMARQALIEMMQADQRKLIERAWARRAPDLPVKSPEEALILASIVEKETGRNDERERVAAVFANRLRVGMKLQSDPTILYGIMGGQVTWGRPIYKAEIAQRTSHNTYQIDGLPPTPICNPGRAAIEATLNPAKTQDLYFVADGSGGHIFSQTLKDHNAAVANWRKVEKDIRAKQSEPATRAAIRPAPAAAPAPAAGGPADGQAQQPAAAAPPQATATGVTVTPVPTTLINTPAPAGTTTPQPARKHPPR